MRIKCRNNSCRWCIKNNQYRNNSTAEKEQIIPTAESAAAIAAWIAAEPSCATIPAVTAAAASFSSFLPVSTSGSVSTIFPSCCALAKNLLLAILGWHVESRSSSWSKVPKLLTAVNVRLCFRKITEEKLLSDCKFATGRKKPARKRESEQLRLSHTWTTSLAEAANEFCCEETSLAIQPKLCIQWWWERFDKAVQKLQQRRDGGNWEEEKLNAEETDLELWSVVWEKSWRCNVNVVAASAIAIVFLVCKAGLLFVSRETNPCSSSRPPTTSLKSGLKSVVWKCACTPIDHAPLKSGLKWDPNLSSRKFWTLLVCMYYELVRTPSTTLLKSGLKWDPNLSSRKFETSLGIVVRINTCVFLSTTHAHYCNQISNEIFIFLAIWDLVRMLV